MIFISFLGKLRLINSNWVQLSQFVSDCRFLFVNFNIIPSSSVPYSNLDSQLYLGFTTEIVLFAKPDIFRLRFECRLNTLVHF